MLKLSKLTKITASASTLALLFSGVAAAQQQSTESSAVGLEISSPIYDYIIAPGKVQQDIVKIKNVGTKEQTYYPEVLDFKSDNKTGTPIFLKTGEENGTYSLTKWIKIISEPIKLQANESTALNFFISVPADAEPGSHFAGILFSTQPPDPTGTNQIGLASKVGSLILVRVAGDAKEAARITEFKTDKQSYNSADVKFSVTVENTGNVHIQPKGVIEIKNLIGGQIATVDVNQLSASVLPASSRIFTSSWKDVGFKFGYYRAKITLNYGNPAQTISATAGFWIIPLKTILIAAILILAALVVLYFAIKKYNAWIVSRATNSSSKQ